MDFNADAANGIAMEGYLYKRASNAFKTWSRFGASHLSVGLETLFLTILSFSRRWFSIQKNQLVYQKKFKVCFRCHKQVEQETGDYLHFFLRVFQDQPTVVVEDLRLCTVKNSTENERRFCFEVVSPSK